MSNQLTSNAEALRLFFTDDVYLLPKDINSKSQPTVPPAESAKIVIEQVVDVVSNATVLPPVVSLPTVEKQETKRQFVFEHLGKNQKGILILVNDRINKVSTPQGTELLRKLVKAIELTNNDFALVNYAGYQEANFQDLANFFNCKMMISFGVSPVELGLSDFPLHVLNLHLECKLVFTKNLHDLETDPASKKILWGSLQKLKA